MKKDIYNERNGLLYTFGESRYYYPELIKKHKRTESETESIDIPKEFWKHFDLFRRGKLSLSDFSQLSGISGRQLLRYLAKI